ncbi:1-(5-phosphoribosyl)-5-[(5-phosphoribosylamino)methylideneamino]imidazole-4-carboxamide isomerase [Bacteroides sp. Marseille-P3684]|uniref:1-(5-phosphoribosyl)-5-[(5- phosphoribosylamino)methylideneamino]imidazole-4- carboxamide isomerase n=1 Tax=Bacteroides sp. Marseille-P3684 TaxID=2086579 RepID=UPI000D0ACD6E|nr:1-(5-phosphoribosyl)-5-[(5-phosphoribosylamino)methylideneamino]imidazole-4-carboxamide isomerase [Bacteroides sp. Marseille-P3684]
MIDIIPAIDLMDGQCVRLSQGNYSSRKVYADCPLDVAKAFEDNGIRRLHLVDLDGAKSKHIVNHKVLEEIATHTSLIIDFGGGIKSDQDLETAFSCGAQMVTIGSIAATQPELFSAWMERFGAERIILGADAKDGFIAVNGWLEDSRIELLPYLSNYHQQGVRQVLCTDISKDGMLQGTSLPLYQDILTQLPGLYLIASGGVSSLEDLRQLNAAGIPAVVVGKAIYENRINLQDINRFIANNGKVQASAQEDLPC